MTQLHDLRALMNDTAPTWRASDGHAEFWIYAQVNGGKAWIGRFRGCSDWTRHREGDAWFQQLDGRATVTLLSEGVRASHAMSPGEAMVVPRGHWYRIESDDWIEQMGIMPGDTEHRAADPV